VAIKKFFKKTAKKSTKSKAKKPAKTAAQKSKAKKPIVKKSAKKSAGRSSNIVKPKLAKKSAKKAPGKPFPAKLQTSTSGSSTTISVTSTIPNPNAMPVVAERRLVMLPPAKPILKSKKAAALKPIKAAPTPLIIQSGEIAWNATELKAIRSELSKDFYLLNSEFENLDSFVGSENLAEKFDYHMDKSKDNLSKLLEYINDYSHIEHFKKLLNK